MFLNKENYERQKRLRKEHKELAKYLAFNNIPFDCEEVIEKNTGVSYIKVIRLPKV